MTKKEYNEQVAKALKYYEKASIVLTEKEKNNIEVADFGLGCVNDIGLQLLVYINTERVCAKFTPHKTNNNDHSFRKEKSGRFAVCICTKCKYYVTQE